jgi:hypothetical protein
MSDRLGSALAVRFEMWLAVPTLIPVSAEGGRVMALARAEKLMCGVALVVALLCLAVIRISCSSYGVGSISIPKQRRAGEPVRIVPSAGPRTQPSGKPRPSNPSTSVRGRGRKTG